MSNSVCACGCGNPIRSIDSRGRPRRFKKGHRESRLLKARLGNQSCVVDGCDDPITNVTLRLCNKHYIRHRKYGDTSVMHRAPNGSGSQNSQGYVQIHRSGSSKKLHVMMAEQALGRPLPEGAEVHHVNGIKHDNRPENLVICQDRGFHQLLHRRTRAIEGCGHAHWRRCRHCKRWDDPARLRIHGAKVVHSSCDRKYRIALRARRAAHCD